MNANVLSPVDTVPTDHLRPRSKLYVGVGVVCALIIFLAFTRTYWAPMAAGSLNQHAAVHVHAVLFFLWTGLVLAQVGLAARGHIAWHRQLGLFGIVLAGAMVVSGLVATAVSLDTAIGTPREPIARSNTALSFGAMIVFSTFITLAIANLRTPERHKRFMVLAMFSILQAAVARIIMLVPAISYPQRVLLGAIFVDLLLLAVIVLDARRHGRLHPVYVGGFAFLVIVQIARRAVLHTPQWLDFTNWLATLAG